MVAALIPAIAGLIQTVAGNAKAKQNESLLEGMKSPTYTPNKGILDYYSEAKRRYETDPYQSLQYKTDVQNINRSIAQGLGGLQDRRSALGGVNKLVAMGNDALLNASARAYQDKNRQFGVLGNATQMKAGEEQRAFQQNQLYPYENKFNLLAQKAAQGASTMNQGIGNMMNGIMNYAMIQADNKKDKPPTSDSPITAVYRREPLAMTYSPGMISENAMTRTSPSYGILNNSYDRFIGPKLYNR